MTSQQLYRTRTASEAWLEAFKAVAQAPGQTLYHLAVQIEDAASEVPSIRHIADDVLSSAGLKGDPTIITVRNTIFPKALARSVKSPEELPAAYEEGRKARQKLHKPNAKGRYFERLIAFDRSDGQPFNQLAHTIAKLRGPNAKARFEMELTTEHDSPEGISVYSAERDADKPARMGFPCLSHLAYQREADLVHCLAFYRSQDMAVRAYGNYWGIGQLQEYVAREAALTPGRLTVIAGIATLGVTLEKARGFIARATDVAAA